MSRLTPFARAYLEAAGYEVRRSEDDFLDMERTGTAPGRLLVWTGDGARAVSGLGGLFRSGREAAEKLLLDAFAREMRAASHASGFYLVESRQGLSQPFVSEATRLLGEEGGIRTPVEFFDAPYRIDNRDARRARSALAELLTKAEARPRVAQPFYVRRGVAPESRKRGAADLVAFLETSIREQHDGPKLRIIEGSAGSGKTVAFTALVASLYRDFVDAKRARRSCRRPVVFLPSHLRGGRVGYVRDVIAAVAQTDIADVTSPEQFRWLLMNGFSIWMFDGLDEFYDGSPDFLSFIEEALSAPGSKAQFILCTRDSLMSSNRALREFVERHLAKGSADVQVYDLAPWTADAWRQMARIELENATTNGSGARRVEDFVTAVESSKEMSALAGLPFYCTLLLERFKKDGALPKDEFDALEFLVERMVDREHGKDIFRWQDYVDLELLAVTIEQEMSRRGLPMPAGFEARGVVAHLLNAEGRDILFELIGSIAHEQRRAPEKAAGSDGLDADALRQLSGLANVAISLNDEVVRRLQTVIVQFAFFGPGRKSGSVDFTHQITADYLAARYAASLLKRELIGPDGGELSRDPAVLTRAMRKAVGSMEILPHSLFCRALARQIRNDAKLDRLFRALRDDDAPGRTRSEAESVLTFLS
jgi:hypothetical protein